MGIVLFMVESKCIDLSHIQLETMQSQPCSKTFNINTTNYQYCSTKQELIKKGWQETKTRYKSIQKQGTTLNATTIQKTHEGWVRQGR